ncbi:MAG: hypothetical protein H8E18_13100, partial [FCB group bacterium]|nr:hypothetical protein [FCB group bacterium]
MMIYIILISFFSILQAQDIYGCTNIAACNYNPEATIDDGSCWYPEPYYDCWGNCINDVDFDGICDEFEECQDFDCSDPEACNYNPWVPLECDECWYPPIYYDCDGNCLNDINENGICDELEPEEFGCIDSDALNYNPNATIDDCSCEYYSFYGPYYCSCEFQLIVLRDSISCLQGGDQIGIYDLHGLLNSGDCSSQTGEILVGVGEWHCEQEEMAAGASNDFCPFGGQQFEGYIEGNPVIFRIYKPSVDQEYYAQPTYDTGTGIFGEIIISVSELDLFPADDSILGCTNTLAINFDPIAIIDDGTCHIPGDLSRDFILDVSDIIMIVDMLM